MRKLLKRLFDGIDKFRELDFDRSPGRIKVVLDDFCALNFDVSVIIADYDEFDVRVAFVPKIEERVCIIKLLGPPFHTQKL